MNLVLELPEPWSGLFAEEASRRGFSVQAFASILLKSYMRWLDKESAKASNSLTETSFTSRSREAYPNSILLRTQGPSPAVDPNSFPSGAKPAEADFNNDGPKHSLKLAPRVDLPNVMARLSAFGRCAHLPGGSEDFAREKKEELDREGAG